MLNIILIITEITLLTVGIILGVLWAIDPNGNYEPFTLLASFALITIEVIRRKYVNIDRSSSEDTSIEYSVGEEKVTFEEKLRSISNDVVKINAYTHPIGIAAEYYWLNQRYPHCNKKRQSLTTLDLIDRSERYDGDQIHFDLIEIELENGREKSIYFDISSFFGGGVSTTMAPKETFAKKLKDLYK